MDIDFDNPPDPRYAIERPKRSFYRIAYWRGNTACFDPDTWDRCTITPTGSYSYGEQTFTRAEAGKIHPFLSFLNKAFDAGRWDAKQEIRDVLGV